MDVGEVEARACLVRDRVVEVCTGEVTYVLGVIVVIVRVIIVGDVVVLVVRLLVLEVIVLVGRKAVLEVVLVIGGTMVPVVIVCHELPFSSLAYSAW